MNRNGPDMFIPEEGDPASRQTGGVGEDTAQRTDSEQIEEATQRHPNTLGGPRSSSARDVESI